MAAGGAAGDAGRAGRSAGSGRGGAAGTIMLAEGDPGGAAEGSAFEGGGFGGSSTISVPRFSSSTDPSSATRETTNSDFASVATGSRILRAGSAFNATAQDPGAIEWPSDKATIDGSPRIRRNVLGGTADIGPTPIGNGSCESGSAVIVAGMVILGRSEACDRAGSAAPSSDKPTNSPAWRCCRRARLPNANLRRDFFRRPGTVETTRSVPPWSSMRAQVRPAQWLLAADCGELGLYHARVTE
jgi:hypothetical protein